MTKVHFNGALVRRLIEHAKSSPSHRMLYEQPGTDVPGLWLVGDDGIYLMSNGLPALEREPGSERNLVAYALECDPTKMDPDDVWSTKSRIFGGDDGVDLLEIAEIGDLLLSFGDAPVPIGISENGLKFYEMLQPNPRVPTIKPKSTSSKGELH